MFSPSHIFFSQETKISIPVYFFIIFNRTGCDNYSTNFVDRKKKCIPFPSPGKKAKWFSYNITIVLQQVSIFKDD